MCDDRVVGSGSSPSKVAGNHSAGYGGGGSGGGGGGAGGGVLSASMIDAQEQRHIEAVGPSYIEPINNIRPINIRPIS